jgi:hypothetical protein
LMVGTDAVDALLAQFFEGVYFGLTGELWLQELRVHQLLTLLSLHQQNRLNDIVMRKIPIDRRLLIHLPHTYTLVVRAADHKFVISTHYYISNPFLMALVRSCVKPRTYFPQLYCLVPWTTYQVVPVHHKIHVTHIVVVSVECLATYKVIIQVP